MSHAEPDERAEWQQYEQDRPLREFLDAVDTITAFIGGEEGRRVRAALHGLAHYQEPPPPTQARIEFDGASVPF